MSKKSTSTPYVSELDKIRARHHKTTIYDFKTHNFAQDIGFLLAYLNQSLKREQLLERALRKAEYYIANWHKGKPHNKSVLAVVREAIKGVE